MPSPFLLVGQILGPIPPRIAFEMRRKAIHAGGALLAVALFLAIPFSFSLGLGLFAIGAITASHYVRRHRVKVVPPLDLITEPIGDALDKTRRAHEDFPWAPVSFTIALVLIGTAGEIFRLDKAVSVAAFGILGMGDAASALIGIAYGRHKLPWNRRKSWEGSIAGFVAAFLSAVLLASVAFSVRGTVLPPEWIGIAAAGAVAGALAESVPNVQDNLVVPLASVAAMVAVGAPLGLA